SDTSQGSKTVQISGKEVMLKDSSAFKQSTGDEAGSAPKKNVITSKIKGKCYFTSWSMDVKIEGENAVRHLDMMTHNHASQPGATPPWPYADAAAAGAPDPCRKEKEKEKEACKEYTPPEGKRDLCKDAGLSGSIPESNIDAQNTKKGPAHNATYSSLSEWADEMALRAASNDCVVARRCKLVPYNGEKDGNNGCCKSQTPDHLIPKASFFDGPVANNKIGVKNYNPDTAPCMCAEGSNNTHGTHGLRHAHHKANGPANKRGKAVPFSDEKTLAAKGATEVFAASGCTQECIEAQLEKGHKDMGVDTKGDVQHRPSGSTLDDAEITRRADAYPTGVAPSR
ncbi:MAG TPA: PAAR-like domain-containing protein, partial [Gemmataceae bacterium]|nr:PAAR-like domain-containing protein [Gemmataceae bacterium]